MRQTFGPNDSPFWARLYAAAEEEVQRLLGALPEALREKTAGIPVVFEPVPGPRMIRDGVEPDLMGLFVGNAYDESGAYPEPTEVILFLQNIWDEAGQDMSTYRRQVRKTLLHEIGHYLGLEEEDLEDRGME